MNIQTTTRMMTGTTFALLLTSLLLMTEVASGEKTHKKQAKCVMKSGVGTGHVTGTLKLSQDTDSSALSIKGRLEGAPDGTHGFHIHEKGELTDMCKAAGAHYNPDNMDHAGPEDDRRHKGDLGNVESEGEKINVDVTDKMASMFGDNTVIGRSIVLHELPDDLGLGKGQNATESKKTGNAGPRLACCKIEEVSGVGIISSIAWLPAVSILALVVYFEGHSRM